MDIPGSLERLQFYSELLELLKIFLYLTVSLTSHQLFTSSVPVLKSKILTISSDISTPSEPDPAVTLEVELASIEQIEIH